MEASISFYERLGFYAERYEDGAQYAFLSMDGVSMHLGLMETPEFVFNPSGVYLHVEDVDAIYQSFLAAGVPCLNTPEDRPWKMREFAVSDPDQTLLRIGQRIASN
jgi:predicted enzyme related to lactoylglutathione lyase